MKRRYINANGAFTLIELIVAMGVMAVLMSVAVWSFAGRMPGNRLRRSALQVAGDMRRARMLAVSENAPVQVRFETDRRRYHIWVDRNRDGEVDPDEVDVISLPAGDGVTI